MQDLPSEEVQEDLIESGQAEEILQKSCPEDYKALKEEEVRRKKNAYIIFFLFLEGLKCPPLLYACLILKCLCESQLVVWVDPLDGTKEYTEGQWVLLFFKHFLKILLDNKINLTAK